MELSHSHPLSPVTFSIVFSHMSSKNLLIQSKSCIVKKNISPHSRILTSKDYLTLLSHSILIRPNVHSYLLQLKQRILFFNLCKIYIYYNFLVHPYTFFRKLLIAFFACFWRQKKYLVLFLKKNYLKNYSAFFFSFSFHYFKRNLDY